MTAPAAPGAAAAAPLPYATLLGFARYLGRTGPAKAALVGGLRRERARRSGFNPHGQLVKALKADIAFHTGGAHLRAVVDAVKPRWRPLYEVLVPGALTYLGSLDDPSTVQVTATRDALGMLGDLPVKVNPHFGLRYQDGRAEAVRLHFDEQPPSPDAVLAILHLMARHMAQILPGAEPVLVDVRRGEVHRADPAVKAEQVERWLTGEAAGFSAMWSTPA